MKISLGRNQQLFLKVLCARTPDTFMDGGSWDVSTTERIGISLAKRGLVDGPDEAPEAGYGVHSINAAGRRWVHDNIDPVSGRRWVLSGEELSQEEYEAYIAAHVARLKALTPERG